MWIGRELKAAFRLLKLDGGRRDVYLPPRRGEEGKHAGVLRSKRRPKNEVFSEC